MVWRGEGKNEWRIIIGIDDLRFWLEWWIGSLDGSWYKKDNRDAIKMQM
jgi:hypothetical protein